MFAELHCRTNFSFLRGASEASELMGRAAELGYRALAITDLNGVYALPRAFEALKDIPDLKLISGTQIRIAEHAPVVLLARDRQAYGLMCRMITAAHYGKEKGEASMSLPELLEYSSQAAASGLVCLVSDTAQANLAALKEVYAERLFVSLTKYLDGLDAARTLRVQAAAAEFQLRIVASNDVYYHIPERRNLQDTLTCIREGVHLGNAGLKLFGNEERYLKSPHQLTSLFSDMPDALQATLDIADSCHFSLSELSYKYPSEWIPAGFTAQRYLEDLVWKGALVRYKGQIPIEVEKQVLHEFHLIERMGYADYFLTVYDIVDFAKRNNIYCQGRGSAANSVICYCLGITVIDPVKMNLLFERFISEDRNEPPDIDVDFEHERREEVIQYLYTKYGRDRAAMISAVRTFQRKSAFLEVSKAIGVPVGTLSANALEKNFEFLAGDLVSKRNTIDELCALIKEYPRHLSIHACGFTLSALPLTEIVPIEPARMPGRTICQWDKNDLDTLKLIKIDVLGLGFLTVIHKVCDLIGIHLWDIPLDDDPKVYDMIGKGDTIGTFQIESRAQIATIGVTQPRNFYDLVVEIALVRPGPNVGRMKSPYISRRENAKRGIPFKFADPIVEKILGRTYGVPIFQEQIMKLAIEKANFSPGEADQLRRAIAAWRSAEAVGALSEKFYNGLLKGGMSEDNAKELFGYMKGFSAYGFPESHSASFAILSYISAWMKCYHPAELLAGLINAQPMGFYPIDVLINDAKRHGVHVLPLHPNFSDWDAKLESKSTVRMGFRNVHGIRETEIIKLQKERGVRPFSSLQDFLSRTGFSSDAVRTMALSDAFACFGLDQRHSFWKSLELKTLVGRSDPAQINLFEAADAVTSEAIDSVTSEALDGSTDIFAPMSLLEGILADYRGLGYSLRGNIMKALRLEHPNLPKITSAEAKKLRHGMRITYAGVMIVLQKPPSAKGVVFLSLEDECGYVDLVLFSDVYQKHRHVIRESRLLVATGRVERRGNSMSLIVSAIESFGSRSAALSDGTISPGEHPRSMPGFS